VTRTGFTLGGYVEPIPTANGPLDRATHERLREIKAIFDDATRQKDATARRDCNEAKTHAATPLRRIRKAS
jgi:hypothetical protein